MNALNTRRSLALLLSLTLAACGEGASFSSTTGSNNDDDDASAIPAGLLLSASSGTLASNASTTTEGVQIKVIVTDVNNAVVPGARVTFSTSAAPNSGTLIVANPVLTNDSGEATAVLTTGGNPQNRTITVFATTSSGGLSASTPIDVIGTTLAISGTANAQIDQPSSYTVTLKNAANQAISNRAVTLSVTEGNVISGITPSNGRTNSTGQLTFVVTPTATAPALSEITVTALGITETKDVNVSTDQFTISTDSFVNTNGEIEIGATPTITVNWLSSGIPKENEPVTFTATLGTFDGATLTQKVVNTDANGNASVTLESTEAGFSTVRVTGDGVAVGRDVEFVAPTDSADAIFVGANPAVVGVSQSSVITAKVLDSNNNPVKNVHVSFSRTGTEGGRISPASSTTDSFGQATVTYTAGTQSSATDGVVITATTTNVEPVDLTDNIKLTVGSKPVGLSIGTGSTINIIDGTTYGLPFTVIVRDAAGQPAKDPDFTISAVPVSYVKGTLGLTTLRCDNEDADFNDIADDGEDINGNGSLDPGAIATVAPVADYDAETGSQQFQLVYAKEYGRFVRMRVTGVVSVTGSESTTVRNIDLTIAEADEEPLSEVSPFGTNTDGDSDSDGIPDGCQTAD